MTEQISIPSVSVKYAHDGSSTKSNALGMRPMQERIYIGCRFKNDTERLGKLFELYTQMTAQQKTSPKTSPPRSPFTTHANILWARNERFPMSISPTTKPFVAHCSVAAFAPNRYHLPKMSRRSNAGLLQRKRRV